MRFLLDTNVISEIRKERRAHPNVARWVARTPPNEIGASALVLAEIRRGIELKRRKDAAQAVALERWFVRLRNLLGDRILSVDEPIAEAWALLSVPDPVPFIDGLLAATAKVRGLTLVTAMRLPSFGPGLPCSIHFPRKAEFRVGPVKLAARPREKSTSAGMSTSLAR